MNLSVILPPSTWWTIIWVTLGWTMHIGCFTLVCIHSLRTQREPSSTILWMFVAWSLPVIGPAVYLMFGVDRVPDKGLRKYIADRRLLQEREARKETSPALASWHAARQAVMHPDLSERAAELNKGLDRLLVDYPVVGGNCITPLLTGDQTYPAMLEAIRNARDHIHLQSFIIQNDSTGRMILDALAERAADGVKVKVLYDRFGSTSGLFSGFFRKYNRLPNMEVVGWTQVNPLRRQYQVNLRNHRKLMIIDGRQAFIGGINLHDENRTHKGHPPIQDYHFRIVGPFVPELQFAFIQDWFFMTHGEPECLLREEFFPAVATCGETAMRLVPSGPIEAMRTISDILFTTLALARKQVLVVTPYFVPPREIHQALRSAALRGVEVRLVVPMKNNHLYAGLAGRAHYEDLMEAGVRIFERPPPFMHAKAIIVDDALAMVGTANWDVRSMYLNYETNVIAYDEGFVNEIKRIVLDEISGSREIELTSWRARPPHQRLAENLCVLMTPIL